MHISQSTLLKHMETIPIKRALQFDEKLGITSLCFETFAKKNCTIAISNNMANICKICCRATTQ